MDYKLKIYLNDEDAYELNVTYETDYSMKTNVGTMGNSGVWKTIDNNELEFIPAHRIESILVKKLFN